MKDVLLLALGGLILMQLVKRSPATTIPPVTLPSDQEKALLKYDTPRMGGFFGSGIPGARPQQPFQVRWGDGNNFMDTTKKARLVV